MGTSRLSWQDLGKCLNYQGDPNDFFASNKEVKKQNRAKSVCDGCPVRRECLSYAMNFRTEGIFGGTNESERELFKLILAATKQSLDVFLDSQLQKQRQRPPVESRLSGIPKLELHLVSHNP